MARAGAPREAGFTLVEALASLTVLALLSLMVLTGIGGRSVAWTRMAQETDRVEAIGAIAALVDDRIRHIWPVTLYNIIPPGPDFNGARDRIAFLAPPLRAQGQGPLRRYQLALDTSGALVLDSVNDLALDPDHWSDRQVLMRGVQSLEIAYFGATKTDPTQAWRDTWSQQTTLPSLVRVRLTFPQGDRRRWPDLIVHPMADIDAGCRLQVPGGGCKGR